MSDLTVRPQLHVQWNLPERSPLVSDHLTKIPIGSSLSQIAISETFCKRPPLLSDHLTKIQLVPPSVKLLLVKLSVSDHLS